MSERALRPVLRQPNDIGWGFMLALLAFIAACLVLILGLAYWLFPGEVRDQRFAQPLPSFPAPVLQPSPPVDMATFYAEEMRLLNSAGWQNRAAGTLHIPIDQAMRAVAAEGIPGWPTGPDVSDGDRR